MAAAAASRCEQLRSKTAIAEERLETLRIAEESSLKEERTLAQSLRSELTEAEQKSARLRADSGVTAGNHAELEARLAASEAACSELESQVARQDNWRKRASKHIVEMSTRGQALEREREDLKRLKKQCAQKQLSQDLRREGAERGLRESELLSEALEQRASALEARSSRLASALMRERACHAGEADGRRDELVPLRRQLERLQANVRRTRSSNQGHDLRLQEAATREDALARRREGERWRALCSERQAQVSALEEELAHALSLQQAEASSAKAWQEAQDEAQRFRQEMAERLRAKVRACEHLRGRLDATTAAPSPAQVEVHALPGRARDAARDGALEELDAYAARVERLQCEIRWARADREAADRSLESLRSSYDLLLRRTGGAGCGGGQDHQQRGRCEG